MPNSSTDERAIERTPLLQSPSFFTSGQQNAQRLPDAYKQFCYLIGNPPADYPPDRTYHPPKDSLYHRAVEHRKSQGRMYAVTSALINTMLLTQVVLGAALTGMGASNSPGWIITVFGAVNTIIAGLVAFMKSRGQPMRARMFRDDLERVVDEIDNSACMWKGISQGIHGYDAIDTDEAVTVRSEVARLTRLYDRAVKTNTINDPDYYGGAGVGTDPSNSGLRSRPGQTALPAIPAPATAPVGVGSPAPSQVVVPVADPEESPATKVPAPAEQISPKAAPSAPTKPADSDSSAATPSGPATATDSGSSAATLPSDQPSSNSTSAPASSSTNPDESPASAARPPGVERTQSKKPTTKVTEDLSHPLAGAVTNA